MPDWGVTAATRFATQERNRAVEFAMAQARYQSRLAQAPKWWDTIREAFISQIRSFNECVGREVLSLGVTNNQRLTALAKIANDRRAMCADFDPSCCAVMCSAYSMEGIVDFNERYGMAINSENCSIVTAPGGGDFTPDAIAERMLNGLMGWEQYNRADLLSLDELQAQSDHNQA